MSAPLELKDLAVKGERFCRSEQGKLFLQVSTRSFLHNRGWKEWAKDIAGLPGPERQRRSRDIEHALHQARKFCLLEDAGELQHIPFSNYLALSIRMIGILFEDVLIETARLLPREGEQPRRLQWGLGLILRQRLCPGGRESMSIGLCPNMLARFHRYLPATAMYYISSFLLYKTEGERAGGLTDPLNERAKSHYSCTPTSCFINNIDMSTYIMEHCPCCDTSCGLVGPDMSKVQEILDRGNIPLIRFVPDDPKEGIFTNLHDDQARMRRGENSAYWEVFLEEQRIVEGKVPVPGYHTPRHLHEAFRKFGIADLDWTLDVVEYDFRADRPPPYVAISHVWSDGLGNTTGNTIPRCRMPFIQRAVWLSRTPMDYDPKDIRDHNYRPNYIDGGFIWPYVKNSSFPCLVTQPIMPFWFDTFCVPRSPLARDKAIRLMTRTYQSAATVIVLDQKLCGTSIGGCGVGRKFRGRTWADAATCILMSPWMGRLWTLQEGLLAKKLLFMFQEGFVDAEDILMGIRKYGHNSEPGHVVARQLATALQSMISGGKQHPTARVFKVDGETVLHLGEDIYPRLALVWNAAVDRTASRAGDVPICVGSSLGLDVTAMHSTSAKDRSWRFYQAISAIPQSIVFNGAEKLGQRGYRWADKHIAQNFLDVTSPRAIVCHNPESLRVTAHTYSSELNLKSSSNLLRTPDGEFMVMSIEMLTTDHEIPKSTGSYEMMLESPCVWQANSVVRRLRAVITSPDPVSATPLGIRCIEAYAWLEFIGSNDKVEWDEPCQVLSLGECSRFLT